MNGALFDDLSRALGSDMPRRQALKLMLGVASQALFFPQPTWAGFCEDRTCPSDKNCSKFDESRCVKDGGRERIEACSYTNDCGRSGRCIVFGTFLFACERPTPFCLKKGRNQTLCVECKEDSHCKDQGQAGECCDHTCCKGANLYCVGKACVECRSDNHCRQRGKGECCNHVCCEVCQRCDEKNLCSARCPDPKAKERTECCTKKGGTEFSRCCKPGCCNKETGECIQPTGKIAEYYSDHIIVEVQETGVGLGRISVHEVVNATVDIPSFEDGTTEPVYVTATKIDLKKKSFLLLNASPASDCGCDQCSDIFDPVLAQLLIPEGMNQVTELFDRIPAKEHYLTLQNGSPGLRRLQVLVNGVEAATRWLRDGSVRFLDIAEWMTEEQENIITVVANGRPGSTALFVVSDVPSRRGTTTAIATAAFVATPPIVWEPAAWKPGQDLHWGR